MRDANYAICAVLVGTIVVTWTLGRFMKRFREPLGVLNAIVIRLCLGLLAALGTAQAAIRGGYWLLLVPVLALLALSSFALAAVLIWAWTRHGRKDRIELAPRPRNQSE